MLPASPRRQRVSSVHPQRYQGFDPKFAQGTTLHYTKGDDLQEMHRTNVADFGGQRPSHTQKLVVVVAVHNISRATSRPGPSKHVGGPMRTVDVVVVVAAVYHISWAAVRAGPSRYMGRRTGRAERPMWSPRLMGHCPAQPIQYLGDGH